MRRTKPSAKTARLAAADSSTGSVPVDERFRRLIELSSDYYWEQDAEHRFVLVVHRGGVDEETASRGYLGKTSWELDGAPVHGTWDEHKALRNAQRPFRDLIVRQVDDRGNSRFISLSGDPAFDAAGAFLGYRGIARDVTQQERHQRLLELDRTVTRLLADAAQSVDALRAAIAAICESEGWEAGQYWGLDPANDVMRFHVGWNVADAAIDRVIERAKSLVFGRGIGLIGAVWESGEPLWVPDLTRETRLFRKDIVEQTGWKNALLVPVVAADQTIGVLDFNAAHIPEPDEYLLHVIGVLGTQIGNFHQRAAALERLTESEERYASTIELAAIGISHVAGDGRFIHVNRQLCEMLGYSKEELLERTVRDISHPDDVNVTQPLAARLSSGQIDHFKVEKRYVRKDGTTIWARLTVAKKRGTNGEPLYDISVVEDVSDRKLAEARVEYLATHDEMTGLPNRTMFGQLVARAIESARRYERSFAVLFIDLDRFKIVNDSLGHEAGDSLLKEMASRFRQCLRRSDVVARLGGDEFVMLVDEIKEASQAAVVARHVLSAALKPVPIKGQECRVTASIGIALYPRDAEDAPSLMKNADMAMYLAKEEGKNNFQFYSKEIRALSIERMALESNLAKALERREFSLHYQAKVSIRTGEIKGVEALLRWWNRDLGAVSPAQFVPVAEETGLIVPIGKWVLQTACAQCVAWQGAGLAPICMAVNISPRQFADPGLLDDIREVLTTSGMKPELLELEITESMVMHNVEEAVRKLYAIKEMGVRLAIDDFGTGYSSLAQLKRFPIDTLKVDRSFIREIPNSGEDMAITEAIIAMGRTLGVTVVAEGVETAEQQTFLSSRACDEMQGYYFSKPSHPDQFADLLRHHTPNRRV
jgi:diguanylate cyclase (GGDEF)-like protein/PAS domain S-box-containing protein